MLFDTQAVTRELPISFCVVYLVFDYGNECGSWIRNV